MARKKTIERQVLVKLLRAIIDCDKTPLYGYDKSDSANANRRGEFPEGAGTRWLEPRTVARRMLLDMGEERTSQRRRDAPQGGSGGGGAEGTTADAEIEKLRAELAEARKVIEDACELLDRPSGVNPEVADAFVAQASAFLARAVAIWATRPGNKATLTP